MVLAAHFRIPLYELMARMSAREFALWQAYFDRVPFGPYVDNWRAGVIAWAVLVSQGGRGISVESLMPGSEAEDCRFPGQEKLAEKIIAVMNVAGKKED